MRKQLGMLTTLLFLCATALVGAGCSDSRCCDVEPVCEQPCRPACAPACAPVCAPVCKPVCAPPACKPACPPVCKPACAPACAPAECCKPIVKCKYPNQCELQCRDGITVTARNPQMCLLGEQYPIDFDVRACEDVCDVVVTTHLPEGVSFIRSQPEAKVDGRRLEFDFGSMSKGECRPAKVWVKCECEGDNCACFCATAVPVRFCSLLCAKPILTCHKCGPEEVCPGEPVNYTITVSNKGSCTAEEVVVTDNVPDGLEHATCMKTLTFKLGNLEPCQTKQVNVCFTAVKRGKVCNTAVVTACNADSVSCQACTCVCCCAVEINKTGTKEQSIGKNADYQIVVTNPGDKVLTDVVVTDFAPSSTSIVAANGAAINGNQAVWRLKELQPGQNVTFNITLTSCTPGCFTNRVTVTDCQGCNGCSEFATRWRGRPALNVCVTETEDMICVGERTSYVINVMNQGSEADNNVVVTVTLPPELKALGGTGEVPAKVDGQTVTFAPLNNLRARQTVSYRVDVEAVKSGDARVQIQVTSDSVKTPIVQQESTVVN